MNEDDDLKSQECVVGTGMEFNTLLKPAPDKDGITTVREEIYVDFRPNMPQMELLKNFKQFNIFECHRRLGKTHISMWILLTQALQNTFPNARYAFVSPEAKQGDRNVGDMLAELCMKIPGTTIYKAEKKIKLANGAQIYVLGIKNEDSLRGGFWDGIILDEFRDMDNAEYSWNSVIRPSLLKWENKERKGWVLITTTPPQKKHYYTELYNMALTDPDWNVLRFPVTKSGLFTEEEIEKERRGMNPTSFAIEMMCSHEIPAEGAYFTGSILQASEQGRIGTNVCYDQTHDVSVSLDLGIDGTAIWFSQVVSGEYKVIDYKQDLSTDKKIGYFIQYLNSLPYRYNAIYLPHDTVKQNQLTEKTIFGEFKAAFGAIVVPLQREPVAAGIYRTNTNFYKCYFNAVKCREGLQALREYSPKKDASKSSFTNKVDHNWASHGADAFRYLIKGLEENPPRRKEYFIRDSIYHEGGGLEPF